MDRDVESRTDRAYASGALSTDRASYWIVVLDEIVRHHFKDRTDEPGIKNALSCGHAYLNLLDYGQGKYAEDLAKAFESEAEAWKRIGG